ncbi:MAG: 16S rRNA (cytidine(1402)-2'-O)-methyltransferase [Pseudomonadota bacterium]
MHSSGDIPVEVGVLYVVATPIGHLDDIGMRAIAILRGVDIIAAEDTRHSSRLLAHIGAEQAQLLSLHEHNETGRTEMLLRALQAGKRVALVSDAGTPLVSDPGYRLVAAAHDAGIRVSPVPGPCAAIAALSAAGLPSDRFLFEGFLPATATARRARLDVLAAQPATLVFYEAPHRLLATLADMNEVLGGNRPATLAREITKTWETIRRGTLASLQEFALADSDQQRGEIVLLVQGAAEERGATTLDETALLKALAGEIPATRAAKIAARLLGQPRRDLYRRLLELGAADGDGDQE